MIAHSTNARAASQRWQLRTAGAADRMLRLCIPGLLSQINIFRQLSTMLTNEVNEQCFPFHMWLEVHLFREMC